MVATTAKKRLKTNTAAQLRVQGAVTSPLREQGVAGLSSIDRDFDPRLPAGVSNSPCK
jgi:hypothetical protein